MRRNCRRRNPASRRRLIQAASLDLDVKVIPRAGRSGFAGLRDGALLVRLAAAPVDGAANEELISLLSKTLKIPKRDITIVAGDRSRSKRIRIAGLDGADVMAKLVV